MSLIRLAAIVRFDQMGNSCSGCRWPLANGESRGMYEDDLSLEACFVKNLDFEDGSCWTTWKATMLVLFIEGELAG